MLVLTGCESNKKVAEDQATPQQVDEQTSPTPKDNTKQQTLNPYTLDKIVGILKEDKTVFNVVESPDKNAVAYMVSQTESDEDSNEDSMTLHIWNVGDDKPQSATGNPESMVGDVFWSPNSDYVFVDSGTFVTRNGGLYSAKTLEVVDTFGYVERVYFSPNSKHIFYSSGYDPHSTVKTVKGDYLDPSEAFDLVLYNMETRENTVLLKGTETQDYFAIGWLDDHTLSYRVTTYSVENNDLHEQEVKYTYDLRSQQSEADPA